MKYLWLLVLGITFITASCDARIIQRCQLAKELHSSGIPKTFISNWVCLVEAESGADTHKVMEHPNLSTSFGIFQINSKEWCRKGRKGGECGTRCEEFLMEDIKDDIRCAKVIYNRFGFKYWTGWKNRCKSRPLPDVSKCSYA